MSAIIEEKNRSLCEKDEVLLQKEQELDQLEKGEGSSPDQRGVTSEPAVTGSHCAPATLGHSSALLQMHQLQNELEALRSCRAQEAVPATTGQGPLQLQGPESLVSAVLSCTGVGWSACSALLRSCLCGKGAPLPRRIETCRGVCVQHLLVCPLITKGH